MTTFSPLRQEIEAILDACLSDSEDHDGNRSESFNQWRAEDELVTLVNNERKSAVLDFMNECKERLPQEHIDDIFREMYP